MIEGVTILGELGVRDMLLSWGEAEAETMAKENYMAHEVAARRLAGVHMAEDDVAIIDGVSRWRRNLLHELLEKPVRWHNAEFPVNELGAVRVIDGWDCPEVKTMAELLLRKPDFAFDVFDASKLHGLPVFVGTGPAEQWCLAEGTHRCLTILRDVDQTSRPLRIIVGISPLMHDWYWWRCNRDGSPRRG